MILWKLKSADSGHFLKSNRLIFMSSFDSGPKGDDQLKKKPTAAPAKSAKPIDKNHFDHFQKRFEQQMNALKKTNEALHKNLKASFLKRFDQLKKIYQKALKEAKGAFPSAKERASSKVRPHLDALIKEIQSRVGKKPAENSNTNPKSSADKPRASVSNKPAKAPLNARQRQLALAYLSKRFRIKSNAGRQALNQFIDRIQLNARQVKQLRLGTLELSKDQLKRFTDMLPKTVKFASSNEFIHVSSVMQKSPRLAQFFANKKSPAFLVLSQHYDIKPNKKGGLLFIEGGKKTVVKTPKELIAMLPDQPADIKKVKDQMLIADGPKGKDLEKSVVDQMNKVLTKKALTNRTYLTLRNRLMESTNGIEKVGMMGSLMMLLQLFKKISQAFKTNDFQALGDYMKAWNLAKSPKGILRVIKKSKDAYEKVLQNPDPKPSLKNLLMAYVKPRGQEANLLFTHSRKGVRNHPLGRFRREARPAIRKYLKGISGFDQVSGIKNKNGAFQILGYKGGSPYRADIILGDTPDKTKVTILKLGKKRVLSKSLTKTIDSKTLDSRANLMSQVGTLIPIPIVARRPAKPKVAAKKQPTKKPQKKP